MSTSQSEHTAATAELLSVIAAFADECRRAYTARLDTVDQVPVPQGLYAAIEAAVASGTAPDWLAAEFQAGRYVPATPMSPVRHSP